MVTIGVAKRSRRSVEERLLPLARQIVTKCENRSLTEELASQVAILCLRAYAMGARDTRIALLVEEDKPGLKIRMG